MTRRPSEFVAVAALLSCSLSLPVHAQGAQLMDKNIAISLALPCSGTGAAEKITEFPTQSEIFYISKTGEAFFQTPNERGIPTRVKAQLNKGPISDITPYRYTKTVNGQKLQRDYPTPYTAEARFDGSTFSFTFSLSIGDDQSTPTVSLSHSRSINLLPGNRCNVVESRVSIRATAEPAEPMNISCGPTPKPGSRCRIGQRRPPELR